MMDTFFYRKRNGFLYYEPYLNQISFNQER